MRIYFGIDMCVACVEYIKGKLTAKEFSKAVEELISVGDTTILPSDHDEKAFDKLEKEEQNEYEDVAGGD
jgi:hypothetical protein